MKNLSLVILLFTLFPSVFGQTETVAFEEKEEWPSWSIEQPYNHNASTQLLGSSNGNPSTGLNAQVQIQQAPYGHSAFFSKKWIGTFTSVKSYSYDAKLDVRTTSSGSVIATGIAVKQGGKYFFGPGATGSFNWSSISGSDSDISAWKEIIWDSQQDIPVQVDNTPNINLPMEIGLFALAYSHNTNNNGATHDVYFDNFSIELSGTTCSSCQSGSCSTEFSNTSSKLKGQKPYYSFGIDSNQFNLSIPRNIDNSINISSPEYFKFHNFSDLNEETLFESTLLKQVKNDSGLTQIDVTSADSYTAKQYSIDQVGALDGNGLYTVTGAPDTEITFSKTVADPNTLNIEEKKGGIVVSNTSFGYNLTSSIWTMGQDTDGDGTNDRFEYEDETTSGSNTIKTAYILDASSVVVSKIQRTYDTNENLLKEIVDPDGAALTTEHTYDTNDNLTRTDNPDGSWVTYTYTTNNDVELTTYSSGLFSKNEYDTSYRVIKIIESFNGSAFSTTESDHKVTTYDYTPVVTGDDGTVDPDGVRTISISLLGNPVSKTWYGYLSGESITVRAATPTSALTDSANMTSTTYTYTTGDFIDQVYKQVDESGNGSLITYDKTGTTIITTTETGVFNSGLTAIINGTSTVQVEVDELQLSTHTFDVATGLLINSRVVSARDSSGRETYVDYHDSTFEANVYNCCNLDSSTSRDGVTTYYSYDSLDRVIATTTNGVTQETFYDLAGRVIRQEIIGTDDTRRVTATTIYDLAGRVSSVKDALNNVTTYSESYLNGQTTRTVTYPDSTTNITVTDSEGKLVSVSGTAVHAQSTPIDEELVVLDSSLGYYVHVQKSGQDSFIWTKSYTDALGRNYKSEDSAGAISTQTFNASGELTKTVSPSGAITLYYNDYENNISIRALDVNQNSVIDYGTDAITRSESDYYEDNDIIWQRSQTWLNPTSLATPGAADNINKVTNDGLLRVNTSVTNGIAATLEEKIIIGYLTGTITTTNTRSDGSYTVNVVALGLLQTSKEYDVNDVLLSETTYGYDNFNRVITQNHSRNGLTTYTYDALDRVLSLKTPDPDGSGPKTDQTFATVYDNMGRRQKVTNPDNSEINFTYTTKGQIETSSGANVYPRKYVYDSKGRLQTLTTYRSHPNTIQNLTWAYNNLGQLVSKTDASSNAMSYTYFSDGRIKTRTNARGVVKTFGYDSNGRLNSISYSDSTPSVSFTYNGRGQIGSVTDAAGARDFNYNTLGQYTGNSWTSGSFSGLSQTYAYDNIGRQQSYSRTVASQTRTTSYEYDDYGRLNEIDAGVYNYQYSYLKDSPGTVEKLTINKNGSAQLHSLRQFDKLMRTTEWSWFRTAQ